MTVLQRLRSGSGRSYFSSSCYSLLLLLEPYIALCFFNSSYNCHSYSHFQCVWKTKRNIMPPDKCSNMSLHTTFSIIFHNLLANLDGSEWFSFFLSRLLLSVFSSPITASIDLGTNCLCLCYCWRIRFEPSHVHVYLVCLDFGWRSLIDDK